VAMTAATTVEFVSKSLLVDAKGLVPLHAVPAVVPVHESMKQMVVTVHDITPIYRNVFQKDISKLYRMQAAARSEAPGT
jgi:hypothetical protein